MYALSASRASGAVIRARIAPQKRAPKRAGRAETRIDPGGRVAREGRAEPEASCRGREWPTLPPASEGRGEERASEGGGRREEGEWGAEHLILFPFLVVGRDWEG